MRILWNKTPIGFAALLVLVFASQSRAALWWPYDLDSLTEKSELILEGHIVAVTDAKAGQVRVRVDHLYQGNAVKENDTLEIGAGVYHKPGKNPIDGEPLGVGDRLFWFVSRVPQPKPPAGQTVVWRPAPGGAKFIYKDRVAEFFQVMNPGPPIAETDRDPPEGGTQPTLGEFRQQVRQSLATVAYFQNGLKLAVAAKDSKKLLELLRGRQSIAWQRQQRGTDFLAGDADTALDALHDYPVLDEALIAGLGGSQGFATQDGLSYLLAKIKDDKLPSAQRITYLRALPGSGAMRTDGGTIIRPANYLLTFAVMAVENAKDRPLSQELIGEVEAWASDSTSLDPLATDDLLEAVNALRPLYDATNDVKVKEQIEWTTCQASDDAYQRLHSPCGPVISVASIPKPDPSDKLPGRDFAAECSISFGFPDDNNHTVKIQPILEDSAGVAHIAAFNTTDDFPDENPSTFTMGSGSESGMGADIHPPAALPAGEYRFYFRFYESGKLLGRSHSAPVTLPK